MSFEVVPLSDALGGEIKGLDLSQPIDDATVAAIEEAWAKHIVLLFRDQRLDEDRQLAFAARFGELGATRPSAGAPPGRGGLQRRRHAGLERQEERRLYRLSPGRRDVVPPRHVLRPRALQRNLPLRDRLPSTGGNTLFANMYKAYERLPAATRERIRGRRALQIYDFAMRERVDISEDIRQYKHCVQPVSISHPVTGQRALYVNPLITARIEDLAERESDELLEKLFAFTQDREIIYEHEWRIGDLVMWDNWCSCHARTDFPATERRMLRRCIIKGQPLYEEAT